jgi:GT2 family glycosyltransferase
MLAFLDADCLVPRHWIASVCRLLEKPAAGIIGCSYSIPAGSGWVARAWYGAGNAPKDGPVTYVPSGDLLVRREDFLRIGGFNESLKTSEDCELCFRAHRAGLPVRSATELAVVHLRTPQTVAGFYKTQRWHGTHVAKVFAANLRERANARAVLLAVCMLLCACAAAAGLAVALLLRSYLLLVGGLGSMIAVSFLCALHRLRHLKGGAFWRVLLPLAFLQAVWGLARAHSLLAVHSSYPRLAGDKAKTKKESASQLDQCR